MIAIAFCAGLLVGNAPKKADEALHTLETQLAHAKGKQEKSLEAIEKAIRNQIQCPVCPVCVIPATRLEVHIVDVTLENPQPSSLEVHGEVELWKIKPPPPELVKRESFIVPASMPTPVLTQNKPLVPFWVWIVGAGVLGVATGVGIACAAWCPR